MSAYTHRHQETDGTTDNLGDTLVDGLARSFTIGTDADGYNHHYFRPADAVVVYDDTGVDHYQNLDGAPILDWVSHVKDRRGWSSKGPHAVLGVAVDRQRKEGDR